MALQQKKEPDIGPGISKIPNYILYQFLSSSSANTALFSSRILPLPPPPPPHQITADCLYCPAVVNQRDRPVIAAAARGALRQLAGAQLRQHVSLPISLARLLISPVWLSQVPEWEPLPPPPSPPPQITATQERFFASYFRCNRW